MSEHSKTVLLRLPPFTLFFPIEEESVEKFCWLCSENVKPEDVEKETKCSFCSKPSYEQCSKGHILCAMNCIPPDGYDSEINTTRRRGRGRGRGRGTKAEVAPKTGDLGNDAEAIPEGAGAGAETFVWSRLKSLSLENLRLVFNFSI